MKKLVANVVKRAYRFRLYDKSCGLQADVKPLVVNAESEAAARLKLPTISDGYEWRLMK